MSYSHKLGVIETDLDDEMVLLDPDTRQMYTVNAVGRIIWLNLPEQGFKDTLSTVTDTFDVDPSQAESDARDLISSLVSAGLLVEGE